MLDALKTLLETDAVSKEVRAEIEEAWNQKVKENRQQATAELREEFAQKYEHDKQNMVEAIDTLVEQRLAQEISEFREDRQQLAEAKAKYAVAMRKNADLMKEFVAQQLSKEIQELREDQKLAAEKFSKLEEFVVESLSKEISEFYEDKQDLAETKVKLVKQAREQLTEIKQDFIKRSSKLVSKTVAESLNKEIGQLKEDIDQARQNDFGRRLFEAFANEYTTSYLNERSEMNKLMRALEIRDKQLNEAKALAAKAKHLAESQAQENKRILQESKRNEIIGELTEPLNAEQRGIMRDLLESVQTDRLRNAFDKYLPTVIDGQKPSRKTMLNEGKSVTGDRTVTDNNRDDNVYDIRRLAGL